MSAMSTKSAPVPTRLADLAHADVNAHQLDDLTVDETIAVWPSTAPVFNAYGLDIRRGSKATLLRAAKEAGMSMERLVAELRNRLPEEPGTPVGAR